MSEISSEAVMSLIEQRDNLNEKVDSLESQLEAANKIIEVLEKSNGFYADKYSWYLHKDNLCEVRRSIEHSDTESFGVLLENGENFLEVLAGKTARLALAEVEKIRNGGEW